MKNLLAKLESIETQSKGSERGTETEVTMRRRKTMPKGQMVSVDNARALTNDGGR